VSLVHQFKISKSHFHKISDNRLHEPDNRLPIQKEIFWTDFILNKRILIVKILRPKYSNQIEILLTNWLSPYLSFSWSCLLTWFDLCSSSKMFWYHQNLHDIHSHSLDRTSSKFRNLSVNAEAWNVGAHQVKCFGIIKTCMIYIHKMEALCSISTGRWQAFP